MLLASTCRIIRVVKYVLCCTPPRLGVATAGPQCPSQRQGWQRSRTAAGRPADGGCPESRISAWVSPTGVASALENGGQVETILPDNLKLLILMASHGFCPRRALIVRSGCLLCRLWRARPGCSSSAEPSWRTFMVTSASEGKNHQDWGA